VTTEERERADQLLERWGMLAIILTRPIPLLAETVAIMAGASRMGWGRTALAALAGSLPPALLYALTGASAGRFQSSTLMFLFVILITGFFWMVGRRVMPVQKSARP
jgi:membrane protein DedA with SNARE-associated domain